MFEAGYRGQCKVKGMGMESRDASLSLVKTNLFYSTHI